MFVPEFNKHVKKRELLHQRRIHLQHLSDLKTNHMSEANMTCLDARKKEMLTEVRFTEIERQNRILLSKISEIMMNPDKKHMRVSKSPTASMNDRKHSLNLPHRKRQFQRIEIENARMLKRLQQKKSHYENDKFQKQWQSHQKAIKNMASFPVILFQNKIPSEEQRTMRMNSEHMRYQTLSPSNRQIKVQKSMKIDGHLFFLTLKISYDKMTIQAVMAKKKDELKLIQVPKAEAMEFIHKECAGDVEKVFTRLRFDGDVMYLVEGQMKELSSDKLVPLSLPRSPQPPSPKPIKLSSIEPLDIKLHREIPQATKSKLSKIPETNEVQKP